MLFETEATRRSLIASGVQAFVKLDRIVITLDLKSNPGLHLIEPYQWALACQAMSEGLAKHIGDVDRRNIDFATPEQIATTLQLLVLNERVSIMYSQQGAFKGSKLRGLAPVNLSGLASTGLVSFRDPPDTFSDFDILPRNREQWEKLRPYLERYEPFILAQFSSRGYPFSHWAIYRYIIAVRTGNPLAASLVEPSIRPDDYGLAAAIAGHEHPDWETVAGLDLKFFNAARRVHQAFSLMQQGEVRVAGAAPTLDVPGATGRADASTKIWQFVVSALIEEQIEFPVPASLADVTRLRSIPEVRAFREFVGPLIDKLVVGDETTYKLLRKEIKAAVRAFKHLPGAKKVLDWTTYAGVPISAIEAITGAIGPSIVTGLFAIGLTKLAAQWQQQERWLYLSSDCR